MRYILRFAESMGKNCCRDSIEGSKTDANVSNLRNKVYYIVRHYIFNLGNTCRSPIAEAIFRKYINENNLEQFWEVDSAALFGYHEGKNINAKSTEVLEKNGIIDYNHVARTIKKEDFYTFDWILGMDYYNLNLLSRMQPEGTSAEIDILGHYDPDGQVEIEDPYCDQQTHRFETIYSQCLRCVPSFIEKCK